MTNADLATLPAELRAAVEAYIASTGLDYSAPAAMHNRCERESVRLAAHLDACGAVDADGFEVSVNAWSCAAPVAIEGDGSAAGHVVCRVEWDTETWEIDLTAAQFASLGWTGPRVSLVA